MPASPSTRGALCGKGRTAPEVLSSRVRLTEPLVRSRATGELAPATWEEALDRIADELSRARAEHGADACGVFGGGGLTNEKAYALGKFARVALGTSQIDYNGRFCMSSAAAAGQRAFGLDRGLPFPLEDVPRTGCVILVGSNLAETMPPALRYLTELRANGGTLIVVDPRRTRTAEQADLHLAPRPGTDLALALGLLHLVVAEGRTDEAYIEERTSGWEEARAAAMAHWPEHVERITGVPVPQLREAVRLFCDAGRGDGAHRARARAAVQGHRHRRRLDQPVPGDGARGAAVVRLRLSHGPGQRPGRTRTRPEGRPVARLPEADRPGGAGARGRVWGVDPDSLPGPGRSAYELLDALGGDIRTLLLMGSNPVVSAPRAAHIEERLRSLDFLAVADVVLSETAALADVVLPVTQWAEETGTTTNLEGRVLLRRRAFRPPAGVRSDLEVLHGLAARLGHGEGVPGGSGGGLRGAAARVRAVRPTTRGSPTGGSRRRTGCSGRARSRRGGHRVVRPIPGRRGCSSTGSPPTDGRARFVPVVHRAAAEEPDAEYPVLLTTGRVSRSTSRGPDAARRRAQRCGAGALRGAASAARRAARRRRRATGRRGLAAGPGGGAGADHDGDPRGHGLHAVPLAGRGPGEHPDATRRSIRLADAGVQGVRGAVGTGVGGGGGRVTGRWGGRGRPVVLPGWGQGQQVRPM